jgi:hypothetical protein
MIVFYANKRWELDMPFQLFQMLKDNRSDRQVEITEITESTYKSVKIVPISMLEDHSIMRNLYALRKC